MLKKLDIRKVLLISVLLLILLPIVLTPSVKAVTYSSKNAIIQVRTQNSNGIPMCTIQFYTQATTYNPGTDSWRIINYYSGVFNQYHFQWNWWWIFPINTKYVYEVLDIDRFEYKIYGLGIIIAGSTWRFKLYERKNPNNYFIFDLHAYVVAGGGTDVGFTPISSSSNGWHHYVEEIDWNILVKEFLGEWVDQKYLISQDL